MGAANSSIPDTVVPVDCCTARDPGVRNLAHSPRRGVDQEIEGRYHQDIPRQVPPVLGLGARRNGRHTGAPRVYENFRESDSAFGIPKSPLMHSSRLQPLADRLAEGDRQVPRGPSERRVEARNGEAGDSSEYGKQHAPQLVAEQDLLRREAPATMKWPVSRGQSPVFKATPQSSLRGSPVTSPTLEYGQFRHGEWREAPGAHAPASAATHAPPGKPKTNKARRVDESMLKLWVDGYLVSSPADRATFEAQLKGEDKEAFFTALFERRQLQQVESGRH